MRKAAAATAAGVLALLGFVGLRGARTLRDPERRARFERQARVWRLTTRRSLHFAQVKVRGRRASEEERARLEEQFAIRSAEDVAKVLGGMKGAIMKAGQMLSFIADGLPEEAKAALATLQADVPPMAPSLAEGVIRRELGADPDKLFLDWDPIPVAAASIGQVHKAVMPDGGVVAVKVQYPGVDKAIQSDLDNAEFLYNVFAQFALKNLEVKALVDELRERMADELDYRHEASCQTEFADRYAGHPFIRIPRVVPERSARRVITSEWVDGMRWEEFLATADQAIKDRAGEVIMRFAQGSIHLHNVFNGDPHPGNYRFHDDGSVTFLDFGLVKKWSAGEFDRLGPVLDAVLAEDPGRLVRTSIEANFLAPNHGFDPEFVFEYVRGPYEPYLTDRFTYTREWTGKALQTVVDMQGRYGDLIKKLNMPTSYVILDRVVWGVSALLSRLEATNNWRAILAEYREGAPACTELGRLESEWRHSVAAGR
ncbi:MAG TPA: AarF/ABC1/UbiB kinase family protein [Acidimicrobiales bacterium]|nr:AarF/ABC1/UbiB kinase family protein [Acidimicrobiales bacterium]